MSPDGAKLAGVLGDSNLLKWAGGITCTRQLISGGMSVSATGLCTSKKVPVDVICRDEFQVAVRPKRNPREMSWGSRWC